MLPLASVDEASGVATNGVSATYGNESNTRLGSQSFRRKRVGRNILEALDEPGEWVVNTKNTKGLFVAF